MLYHYALLPDVFRPELLAKSPNSCTIIKQLLSGMGDNGLLANLHEDAWIRHIKADVFPHLPLQVRDRVIALLQNLEDQNRLITCAAFCNDVPRSREDWLDAAIDVHSHSRLQGIVLTQDLLNRYGLPHEAFMELSNALELPQWLERPRSQTVSMLLPDYKSALVPVLQYAKTLTLIDPYMDCHPRFFDVVEICARLLGRDRLRPTTKRITIHAGNPTNGERPEDRLFVWQQRLRPLVNTYPTLRFRVFLWQEKDRSAPLYARLHDRFIITDQCCISVPGGLDARIGTTPWSLQDDTVCRDQLRKFSNSGGAYKSLGDITVAK